MEINSDTEIAHWFVEKHAANWASGQSCEGMEIWRDGHNYCYAWMCAYIDRDLQGYYLLDVRLYADGKEIRDHLYVTTGMYGTSCQFQQQPVRFEDDTPARLYAGIKWMIDLMEKYSDG